MAWPPGTSIRRFNNRKSIDVASDDVLTARRRRRRRRVQPRLFFLLRCNKNAKPHESHHRRARTASRLDRGRDAKRSGRHASRCASRSSARPPSRAREARETSASPPPVESSSDEATANARAREREATRDEETIAMVTLDADEPVVVDIGARAHVTMSPKRMREMGVSAGAWTTVRCYATPRDDSGVHRRMGASRGRVKGSRTRVEDSKAIERVMRVRREAEEARRAGRWVAGKCWRGRLRNWTWTTGTRRRMRRR